MQTDYWLSTVGILHCQHCNKPLLKKSISHYTTWFLARVIVSHMQRKHPNVVPITRLEISRAAMYKLTQQ